MVPFEDLFTTLWAVGLSLKAIRLGMVRFQHCPVGDHWTFVTPVKDDELTENEWWTAHRHRDEWIP